MKLIARCVLWLGGWTVDDKRVDAQKFVLVAAPHTSNWDFVWVMCIASVLDIRLRWLGKDALFFFPMGVLARMIGGIPVDRSKRTNLVEQIADQFAQTDRLALLISVEGTRSYVGHWRSGFYHIARAASVPVVLGRLNYKKRVGGLLELVDLTGHVASDMDRIRAVYQDEHGKYPEQAGEMRLREEGG